MREAAVIAAALFLEGAHCGDVPPAPYTSRAVLSDWGPAVSGLSAQLAMDSSRVDLGGEVHFEILLRAEPRSSEVSARILNANRGSQRIRLVFQDIESGNEFVRAMPMPYPSACNFPSDRFDLYEGAVRGQGAVIRLLSHEGVQIPAGNYLVHGTYENEGHTSGVRWGEDDLHYEHVEYAPHLLWQGKVETGSMDFEVVHREPEIIRFEIPGIELGKDRDSDIYRWHWVKGSTLPVEVTHWPGYLVGIEARHSYRAKGDSTWQRPGGGHTIMVRDPSSTILFESPIWGGRSKDLLWIAPRERRLELILFESSAEVSKGGFRGANFRILYAWDVIDTWPPAEDDN